MARAFTHQHLAEAPRGWRVRSKHAGDHVLRIAFPPGRRRRGAGRLLEILHPKRNPACENGDCDMRKKNPEELLIFGNPRRKLSASIRRAKREALSAIRKRDRIPVVGASAVRRALSNAGGIGNHKPGCKCPFCERARDVRKTIRKMPAPIRRVFDRNPKPQIFGLRKTGAYDATRDEWVFVSDGQDASVILPKGTKKTAARRAAMKEAKARRRLIPRLSHLAGNPRRRRRRNPSAMRESVALFQSFHGKDPKEVIEKQVSAAVRNEYVYLGDLEYLKTRPDGSGKDAQINFEGDGVKLAVSPNGRQLYLIGGNQNLSSVLEDFTDDPEKDFIDLGEGTEVQYLARKIHGNFEPVSWYHKFGEENGVRPRLMYDKLKHSIFFVGGEYYIDASDAVSPGIEN